MIIHCTKKLAAKISDVQQQSQTETSPMGSWHANLYTYHRHNCVLCTHDETRFSVFLPVVTKSHFQQLDLYFKATFLDSLEDLGITTSQLARVELALGQMVLDTNTDRSVLGSMNSLIPMLSARMEEVNDPREANHIEISHLLSNTPMASKLRRDYWRPIDEMKALIETL